jgi:hypothetical protein
MPVLAPHLPAQRLVVAVAARITRSRSGIGYELMQQVVVDERGGHLGGKTRQTANEESAGHGPGPRGRLLRPFRSGGESW